MEGFQVILVCLQININEAYNKAPFYKFSPIVSQNSLMKINLCKFFSIFKIHTCTNTHTTVSKLKKETTNSKLILLALHIKKKTLTFLTVFCC